MLGTDGISNSTYAYNERGWLNKINDPNVLAVDQIFGMELVYGNKAGTYNGNIGTVNWKTKVPAGLGLTEQLQSYTYEYDKLNRLSKSVYSAAGAANKFNEEMGYDISGNITSLKRANNNTGYLNNFTYNYGAGSTAAQSSNYTYNENGNQKTDSSGFLNSFKKDFDHHDSWTEWSANGLSKDYFKNEKWDNDRYSLFPQHDRPGIYPANVKPNAFYSGKL